MVNSDFVPNGRKTFYWDNGNKRLEGEFRDGVRVGVFNIYNYDGTINQTIKYSNDLIHGECDRFYKGKICMKYEYSTGTLVSSMEYLNSILIGEYGYGDALVFGDQNGPTPPPIGTILHATDGKHPGEVFKGTLWTFVENSFKTDENGQTKPVAVWLREPNGGKGPYIYIGDFKEYYSSGNILRKGSYNRIIQSGKGSISVLNGPETIWRDGGAMIYHVTWNNGLKTGFIEFKDDKERVWKKVRLDEAEKYIDGIYNVFDIGMDGDITYVFDPTTQSASVKILK